MSEVRTASARDKPCELHVVHRPVVVRTQGHHRYPQYLQKRVFGKVTDHELLWVCGTGHDAIHEWVPFLIGDSDRRPAVMPGKKTFIEIWRTVDWYRAATGEYE